MKLTKNNTVIMSKMKKFEDFNTEKVNENLEDITSDVNGFTIYGDGEDLDLNLSTIEEVKKWIIENQINFGEIMFIDEEGDSVIVSKDDTLEDIEMLFSDINNVEMEEEDCGCSDTVIESEEEYGEGFPTNDLAPQFGEEEEEPIIQDIEKESKILEYEEKVNKKFSVIKKRVSEINELISKAIDTDGEKIEVLDPTSTWEEPMVYEPITFENNVLTISYLEPYNRNKGMNTDTVDLNVYLEDIDENHFMLEDAKGDLAYVKRMYNRAIKKATKEGNLATEDTGSNNYSRDMVANELGIDSSEFDDSSDLGMMVDRIGENEEENMEEFVSDDKYYADYMDIAQFHPETPLAITTSGDSDELEKYGKEIVDTKYGGDIGKAYDAIVTNDNVQRWDTAYRKILAIQRAKEEGNITETPTDLINTNESKIVKFDTYFKK
jgi:hypothetical protein